MSEIASDSERKADDSWVNWHLKIQCVVTFVNWQENSVIWVLCKQFITEKHAPSCNRLVRGHVLAYVPELVDWLSIIMGLLLAVLSFRFAGGPLRVWPSPRRTPLLGSSIRSESATLARLATIFCAAAGPRWGHSRKWGDSKWQILCRSDDVYKLHMSEIQVTLFVEEGLLVIRVVLPISVTILRFDLVRE